MSKINFPMCKSVQYPLPVYLQFGAEQVAYRLAPASGNDTNKNLESEPKQLSCRLQYQNNKMNSVLCSVEKNCRLF